MSENSENEVIHRCPTCLNGGTDIYLVQDGDDYRCLKCSYTGKAAEIKAMYGEFSKKYRLMGKRITLEDQRNM